MQGNTLPEFSSMPTKQWLQVEVGNEIVMHFLLSLISDIDFKPLVVPIETNSGSVYWALADDVKIAMLGGKFIVPTFGRPNNE